MKWWVDASVLIALAKLGELRLLAELDGTIVVPGPAGDEVTSSATATELERFREREGIDADTPPAEALSVAQDVLGEASVTGDVAVVAAVLDADDGIGVASDDRRVRTTVRQFGADVTGSVGVLARAVRTGRVSADAAKQLLDELDGQGFHMSASLRRRAEKLIDGSATD